MKANAIPSKYTYPWAKNAGGSYIRTIPVTTADPTAASESLGWPPETATPVGAGGTPPDVRDANGILNQETSWTQWFSAGGPLTWDSTFSANIGGYPKGALVQSATQFGLFWFSTADDNTDNPDSGTSSKWTACSALDLYGVDTGTANAGVITLPVAFSSLPFMTGFPILVQKAAAANTGGYTLNPNGLGAVQVLNPDGSQLSAGELPALAFFVVVYTGSVFQLVAGGASATGITASQLQTQAGNYAQDTGTLNALVITLSTIPANLAALTGTAIRIKKAASANTGACTLAVNGFTAGPINHVDGTPVAPGELPGGCTFEVIPQGTGFVLQTGTVTPAIAQAQASNYGLDTGSANAYVAAFSPAVTIRKTGAPFRVLIGNTNTAASTLDYGAGPVAIRKTTSAGLKALSGGELVAGQIYEFIDNGTFIQMTPLSLLNAAFISAPQAWSYNNEVSLAHGVANPQFATAYLVCTTAQGGYAVGQKMMIGSTLNDSPRTTLGFDGTNVWLTFNSASNGVNANNKGGGGGNFTAGTSSWQLVLEVWGS